LIASDNLDRYNYRRTKRCSQALDQPFLTFVESLARAG